MKFIFVTGGVISSLGKGLIASSIGLLMKARDFKVNLVKIDPYLQIDAGTMSPYEHGEVFVTDDGGETDLDIGNYERFLDMNLTAQNSITTGKIYWNILTKERQGRFLGKTVQVIPHITDEIKSSLLNLGRDFDFTVVEIGGTVGDIESQPFLEAIRQMKKDLGKENVLYVHVSLLPYIKTTDEVKTKPTQHSVKELRALGITPDILFARTRRHRSRYRGQASGPRLVGHGRRRHPGARHRQGRFRQGGKGLGQGRTRSGRQGGKEAGGPHAVRSGSGAACGSARARVR